MKRIDNAQPRNVIFILSDDHRYDFMGFTGKVPWLETPNMDRLAREGAYFPNAFVTTSLCSPSRASILTGQFSHTHTVIDNQAPAPESLIYFPQYLQEAGYQTGFFWQMAHGRRRRSASSRLHPLGELPADKVPTLARPLNINGERKEFPDAYTTDLLTEHALDWLQQRDEEKPFFLYLSHKAVHAMFEPAPRHQGKYENEQIVLPPSFYTSAPTEQGARVIPTDRPSTPVRSLISTTPIIRRIFWTSVPSESIRASGNRRVTKPYYGGNTTPDWQKEAARKLARRRIISTTANWTSKPSTDATAKPCWGLMKASGRYWRTWTNKG